MAKHIKDFLCGYLHRTYVNMSNSLLYNAGFVEVAMKQKNRPSVIDHVICVIAKVVHKGKRKGSRARRQVSCLGA